jgi:D-alanine-D-alanine ligase
MKKIALVAGGPSSEHEVSINSTKAILAALDRKKYDVYVFYITKDLQSTFFKPLEDFKIPNETAAYVPLMQGIEENLTQVDLAFLAGIHGEFVEDGQLQSILDVFKIKYSGSDRTSSALCMDKYRSSLIVNNMEGLMLPDTDYVDITLDLDTEGLSYPLICKPNSMGSSVGLAILNDEKELRKYFDGLKIQNKYRYVLLQEYIHDGVEVSCGCLEDKNGEITMLPPVEIVPLASKLFDYKSKYEVGGAREVSPPPSLSEELSNSISILASQIHVLLGCHTYSRSDFMIKDEKVYYMETNTLPGMTSTSLLPKETKAIGMDYRAFVEFLIENSL